MTIDEAIKTLHSFWAIPVKSPTLGQLESIKLGIEALKQLQKERLAKEGFWRDKLDGETEE